MPRFNYVAMDSRGKETKGTLEVANQNEAIARVKEMGFFPTKIIETDKVKERGDKKARPAARAAGKKGALSINIKIPGLSGRVSSAVVPLPSIDRSRTVPPRPSARAREITRPRPDPGMLAAEAAR